MNANFVKNVVRNSKVLRVMQVLDGYLQLDLRNPIPVFIEKLGFGPQIRLVGRHDLKIDKQFVVVAMLK